jgi:hypothetical protein
LVLEPVAFSFKERGHVQYAFKVKPETLLENI